MGGNTYMGKEFQQICSELGIIHETTLPYTPEHNSIAEHYNRTLQEGALTLRHDSGLSAKFWVSAIHTINFVRNRILHSCIGISPHGAFWGTKPKIDWLRTYGSKCWALVPKAIWKKGEYCFVKGIFVGYFDDLKAYKVWVSQNHTILKVHDAIFDESNHIEQTTIHATDEDDLPNLWDDEIPITITPTNPGIIWNEQNELPFTPDNAEQLTMQEIENQADEEEKKEKEGKDAEVTGTGKGENEVNPSTNAPFLDFEKGP